MEERKKVIYLAGPITGVADYWEPFYKADAELTAKGFIVLNPARLPQGMTNAQYMRICESMMDCADAVLMLPGWRNSKGATLEWTRCKYIYKHVIFDIKHVEEVLK